MSQNLRKVKKGELLYKEGQKADSIFLIQSGRILIYSDKGAGKYDMEHLITNQVVGLQALFGVPLRITSAEGASDSTLVEIPIASIKNQIDGLPNPVKIMMKSMSDEVKNLLSSVKSLKMETETGPCPQINIPRLFSVINLVGRHAGKKNDQGEVVVPWLILRTYAVRMFLESPARLQGILEILKKLGHVNFEVIKNEKEEDEIQDVHIKNIQMMEDFAEFYQYNLYKPGKSEIIYVDDVIVFAALKGLVLLSDGKELDRHGAVRLVFNDVVDEMKRQFRFQFKSNHVDFMERKGLLTKRQTVDGVGYLIFDRKEFVSTYEYWRILREIEKWNKTGRINLNEKEEDPFKNTEDNDKCPQCEEPIANSQKFCANCGHKLVA